MCSPPPPPIILYIYLLIVVQINTFFQLLKGGNTCSFPEFYQGPPASERVLLLNGS